MSTPDDRHTAAGGPGAGLPELLLDAVEQAIIATDPSGRIVVWNRFAEVMYGWSAAEVVGRAALEVTPSSATVAQAHAIMRALSRGERWRGELEVRHKDGSTFTATVVNSPIIRDGDLVGVVGMSVDVTERLAAQTALRESEERFRDLADNLPLLVWQHDADGRQEWVNVTFCTFFGVDREEMRADRWQLPTHPDDGQRYVQDLLAAIAERRPFHGEVRARRADGQWRWLESWSRPRLGSDGTFLGHLGSSVDVTEHKRAEITLSAAAAAHAYRARLADTLRPLTGPAEIAAAAARILADHLGVSRVRYVEIDQPGESATVLAAHPASPPAPDRHCLDDDLADLTSVCRTGQQVVVDDVRSGARMVTDAGGTAAGLGAGAYVVAPVHEGSRTVAAIAVHHRRPRRWSPDELTSINDTAERTSAAVQHARDERDRHEQHARAQLVVDVLSAMERHRTVAAQAQALTDVLVPRVADYATVEAPREGDFLLALTHRSPDQAQILRRLRTEHRLGPGEARILYAAAGASARVRIATADMLAGYAHRFPDAGRLLAELATRSHIAVPLALGDARPGVLLIGLTEAGQRTYGPDYLAFLDDLARRVGVILMSAHVRQQEHDIAVRLQKALLPDRLATHPRLGIEARYRAGDELLEVGGDWYDTFTWPDGRIGVIVGDVAGHTTDAAITMGRLRSATAALVTHAVAHPVAVLDTLDGYGRGCGGAEFLTAVCIIIDPESGLLTYASAGHPPPIVLTPGRAPRRLCHARAAAIHRYGPDRGLSRRPSARITLEPGSLVIMYSDGLVERRHSTLDAGIARLESVAAGLSAQPLPDIADQIVARMTDNSPTDDDIVLVCLRYAARRSSTSRSLRK